MITYNSGMLYSSFMGDGDLTKKFSQVLFDICPEIDLKNLLLFYFTTYS